MYELKELDVAETSAGGCSEPGMAKPLPGNLLQTDVVSDFQNRDTDTVS